MGETEDMSEETEKVVIPKQAVDASAEKKKRHRTLRQLPIYRDMTEFKYLVVVLLNKCERKNTKMYDNMLNTVCEAKKCVGLGESARNPEERAYFLSMARIFIEDAQDDIAILNRLNLISRDTEKSMKALAKRIVAQCVAWRDYENGRGV